mgnify:CR=1 FL=1
MSFIFADASAYRIIDIVEDRRYYHLEKYFKQFTKTTSVDKEPKSPEKFITSFRGNHSKYQIIILL